MRKIKGSAKSHMHVVDFTILTAEISAGEASGDESSDGGHSTSRDTRTLGSRVKTAGGGKQGTRGSSSKPLVKTASGAKAKDPCKAGGGKQGTRGSSSKPLVKTAGGAKAKDSCKFIAKFLR